MKARQLVNGLQRWLPTASDGAVVLAYHLVGTGTRSPVDIPLEVFREQLDQLKDHRVVHLDALLDGSAPPRSIAITFDDAYRNFLDVAWPELRARHLPCTLYAPLGFVRGTSAPPITGARLPACSFAELRALAADGVEIGSHGVLHLNLRRVDDDTLARELDESREVLEQELQRPITSFCYPQAKYDARAVAATRRRYRSAVVGGGTRFGPRTDPLRIPRFPIRCDEGNFEDLLRSRVWLSEAIASRVRQLRA